VANFQYTPTSQATDVMVECMKNEQFEDAIARVIKNFEGWECYIEIACHENGEFRSLCEDYAVCAHSLENWQASDKAVAVQRQQEYTELLAELKQEIHSWLDQRYVQDPSDNETGPLDPLPS
jgi:hypothetical protein